MPFTSLAFDLTDQSYGLLNNDGPLRTLGPAPRPPLPGQPPRLARGRHCRACSASTSAQETARPASHAGGRPSGQSPSTRSAALPSQLRNSASPIGSSTPPSPGPYPPYGEKARQQADPHRPDAQQRHPHPGAAACRGTSVSVPGSSDSDSWTAAERLPNSSNVDAATLTRSLTASCRAASTRAVRCAFTTSPRIAPVSAARSWTRALVAVSPFALCSMPRFSAPVWPDSPSAARSTVPCRCARVRRSRVLKTSSISTVGYACC